MTVADAESLIKHILTVTRLQSNDSLLIKLLISSKEPVQEVKIFSLLKYESEKRNININIKQEYLIF